jgi:hypothetical protein
MIHLEIVKFTILYGQGYNFKIFRLPDCHILHLPLTFHHMTSRFSDGAQSKCEAMNSTELTRLRCFHWIHGKNWTKIQSSQPIVNGSRDSNRESARMVSTILNKQLGRFFMNRSWLEWFPWYHVDQFNNLTKWDWPNMSNVLHFTLEI